MRIAADDLRAVTALSKKTAAFAESLHDWVPWHLPLFSDGLCIYCGEPAECRDHLIPLVFLSNQKRTQAQMWRGITIDCCNECNGLLSSKIFFSFYSRLASARIVLTRRYKKYYAMPEWDYEELDELNGSLKDHVFIRQMCRSVIVDRLNWQFTKQFHGLLGSINRRVCDYSTNPKLLGFFGLDSFSIDGRAA